jgi:hypothetical protein
VRSPPRFHNPFCSSRTDRILAISGNALTDFFLRDVGITQFQFNIGQQLLSAGIVLLEVNTYQSQAPTTQTADQETDPKQHLLVQSRTRQLDWRSNHCVVRLVDLYSLLETRLTQCQQQGLRRHFPSVPKGAGPVSRNSTAARV